MRWIRLSRKLCIRNIDFPSIKLETSLQPRHSLPPTTLRARDPAGETIDLVTRKHLPQSTVVCLVESASASGLPDSIFRLLFGMSLQIREQTIYLFAGSFERRFGD